MHDDDSTDPTTPIAPITPSGRRRSRSTRMVISVGVAAAVAVVVVASVTFLGRNASAKYSSVASAICDSRLPLRGAGGVVVPPAEVPPLAQL